MELRHVLQKRNLLLMLLIHFIFFGPIGVSLPIQAQAANPVTFYVKMPNGYIPGAAPGELVTVEVWVESPIAPPADGIVAWTLSLKWDPTVLEIGYFVSFPPPGITLDVAEGSWLKNWTDTYPWPYGTTFFKGSIDKEAGNVTATTCGVNKWTDLPSGAGANGTGQLAIFYFTSKNETAYSPLDLLNCEYSTTEDVFPNPVIADGHYNQPPKGSLLGKVIDADSLLPIAGATISYVSGPIAFNDTTTNTNGNYTIADLALGNYSIVASRVGYGDQTKNITIIEEPNTLNFELTSIVMPPGWIEGFIIDNTTKTAIPGATVTANGAYNITDDTGYYKIDNLPPTTYTVTAGAVGYPPQSKIATVTSEAGTTLNFTLKSVSPYIAVVPHGTMDPDLTPGKNFTISIYTNYTGDDVWGYGFSLTYNPLVLQGVEVTNGDLITVPDFNLETYVLTKWIPGTFDNEVGKLTPTGSVFQFSDKPAPLASGPGTLATVAFQVVGIGASDITLVTEVFPSGLRGYAEGINPETNMTEPGWGDPFWIIYGGTEPDRIQHGFFTNVQSIHDVAVINIEAPTIAVAGGDDVPINVTVVNEGIYLEVVNLTVTIYNDTTEIRTESFLFNLASGLFRVNSFSWDTAGLTSGTYTINATATTFNPDEDPDDNTKTKQIEIITIHDVAVINIEAQDEATVKEIVPINVTVANKGSFYENVNVTVSYEDTLIGITLIDMLSPGESEIVDFSWDTAGSTLGLYTINAMATIASDANITNNSNTKKIYLNLPLGAIVGTVTDALTGDPIQGATINADGYSASTDADGHYNITDIPLGTYTITASKTGYESASQHNILVVAGENPTVNFTLRVSSNITISADPVNIRVGASTTISGSIEPARKGVAVTIWYRLSGEEAWTNLTTVTTNEQSQYSDVWTPETAGTYEVKASWLGDESISSAESDVQSITVQDTSAPSVPLYIYMAVAGVAAIILAAMAFYFLRVKKPKPT